MAKSDKVELKPRKSPFIDIFRSTPTATVCPNFYVMAHANGCRFAPLCSYCYLKSSFLQMDSPRVFDNLEKLEKELLRWFRRDDLESYIMNTGNLSDSLAFEADRPMIGRLVELFRDHAEAKNRKHTLLLVTKGGMHHCRPLLDRPSCKNVIVSFSVNSSAAAAQHERGAATVEDRLAAATRLLAEGWRVRMRIDPMILGFDYAEVIAAVRALGPERVTLGTLRAEKSLQRVCSGGIFRELQTPDDPKALARYPRQTRLAMYSQAVQALRDVCPIGLCEETEDVWRELGLNPQTTPCNCGG